MYGLLHIGKTGGTAAKTVLRASRDLGVGEPVTFFKHEEGLAAIAEGDLCARLMFFIREPVDRFISAFNSRLREGLPPTPIGNPSLPSLEAALAPVESEYWYYLHDGAKILHPGKNAAEHEALRRKYGVY